MEEQDNFYRIKLFTLSAAVFLFSLGLFRGVTKPRSRSYRSCSKVLSTAYPGSSVTISVQFIRGLDEEISGVSLRQRKDSPNKIVMLLFERCQAMEKLRSFTNGVDSLWLEDEEGEIQVFPSGIKFFFRNDDDLAKVECSIELRTELEYERVKRFLHRYAEAHGFQFESR